MRKNKLLAIATWGSLALTLTACAPMSTQDDWAYKGFQQWHPQSGDTPLATVGTQCFFCAPTTVDKPERPLKFVEPDNDGDGVPNSVDECPNTPIGVPVDIRGCPLNIDNDRDGIPENGDRCPNTPVGAKVDVHGCWTLPAVHFGSRSSKLNRSSQRVLKELLLVLKDNPHVSVAIQGFTDNSGRKRLNNKLAERRAKAVMNYLIMNGIAKSRLTTTSMGAESPVASNNTRDGRAKNRRVEIIPNIR
ncbi:MAG: OmpA family protein [Magnetococcales bacterium]|nr:OmpA family protein [Magnetococcales bacterium]